MKVITKLKKYFAETIVLWRGLTLQEQLDAIDKENKSFLKRAIKRQRFDDEAVIKLFLFSSLNYYYYSKYGCSNVVKTAVLQASHNVDFGISTTIVMEFRYITAGLTINESRLLCLKLLACEDEKVISFFQKIIELDKFKRRIDEINSLNAHAEAMETSGERVAYDFAMGGDFGSTSLYTPINMDWVEDKIAEYLPDEEIQKKIIAIDEQVFTKTMRRVLTEFEVWWNKSFNHERKFLMV